MKTKLFPEERLELIYSNIKKNNQVHVNELAVELSMCKSTVRTDLAELESRGLITRTHGGAILKSQLLVNDGVEMLNNTIEIDLRIQENQAEKEAIGQLAATMINDGDTIMIDGGSTTQFVGKHLCDKNELTIITNSFYMLPELLKIKNSAIYLAGGLVYKKNSILLGDMTNEFINHFNPKKLILGIDGLSVEQGLTVADSMVPAVASIKRKMIDACSTLIVVCDHSKLGRACVMPIASLKKVNYLVTDDKASPEIIEAIRAIGPVVMLAHIEE